jgi:hypothetical protein
MSTKALLIQSDINITTGVPAKWNPITVANQYINGIVTGAVNNTDMTPEQINTLISGLPSPWARAKLFRFAMKAVAQPNSVVNNGNAGASALQQFYEDLIAEWKGLIAVLALYPDRIAISKPIELNANGALFDIAAAFGRMLFTESDVWCNQDLLLQGKSSSPFIQLIYYRNQLVGATSPFTGFFTGVDYSKLSQATDIPWYKGRFQDPILLLQQDPADLQKVYLFVKNMNTHLDNFSNAINSARNGLPPVDINNNFGTISHKWEQELKNARKDLKDIGPVASYDMLSYPYSILFDSKVPVYVKKDGMLTYTQDNNSPLLGSLQGLLSSDEYVVGWREAKDVSPSLKDAPVYLLRVPELKDESTSYFSIPLSDMGFNRFYNKLAGMLGYGQRNDCDMTAHITDDGRLAVSFTVKIDGADVALGVREYNIHWITEPRKVILWPNFVSNEWNRYYLYSEFTYAAEERFSPFFNYDSTSKDFSLIPDKNELLTSDYQTANENKPPVKIDKLVTLPMNAGDDIIKYNVVRMDKPIAGLLAYVKNAGVEKKAGLLPINKKITDRNGMDIQQKNATVGIDFGSNNTCIYYSTPNAQLEPVHFDNYRVMLVGMENSNPNRVANVDELLFFTNYETKDGQFKSWLHEHDARCVGEENADIEVAGGVPVNRPNVQVNDMTPYVITTQAGKLHYNMKWLNDDKGLLKKRAFLESLWLQTCAYLYSNSITPSKIRWSYPGSMMPSDVNGLETMFDNLKKIYPITSNDQPIRLDPPITESEAVCSYSLSKTGLNRDNMILGLDVGGSTSDILLLCDNNGKGSLYRENSIRLAAGVFFNAVINSGNFRKALVTFHNGRRTGVNVMNIDELSTADSKTKTKAPYYLNSIFDQLKPSEYSTFYESLTDHAKFVFTIPAYVSGALLFYSGMLIGKVLKDNSQKCDSIESVDIYPYGKGGRLFHWLYSAVGNNATSMYYTACINGGVSCVCSGKSLMVNFHNEDEVARDNKTEVARGLCNSIAINMMPNVKNCDICGETGVKLRTDGEDMRTVAVDEDMDESYFTNELQKLNFEKGENFSKFLNIFIPFISQTTNLYPSAQQQLQQPASDYRNYIKPTIQNDEEYKKARNNVANNMNLAYHQPIFIIEAKYFLEQLIQKVFV